MKGKIYTSIFTLLFCVAVTHAGVSYIRWGRTVCPEGNIPLYKGYITGAHNGGTGSGANYLCSSQNPKFVRATPGMQDGMGSMWGMELEPQNTNLFLSDNLNGGQLANQDMMCVRCHDPSSADVFMLPGRDDCESSSYELKYKGFLVSEAQWPNRQTHEYICMDESPEGRPGGTALSSHGLLYPVQVGCGSLPCGPYTDGLEATCAVCAY